MPDDVIVADDDGAVVIPNDLVDEMLTAGPAAETFEAWVLDQVNAGVPLPGLYPPDAATTSRYEQHLQERNL